MQYDKNNDPSIERLSYLVSYNVICLFVFVFHPVVVNNPVVVVRTVFRLLFT